MRTAECSCDTPPPLLHPCWGTSEVQGHVGVGEFVLLLWDTLVVGWVQDVVGVCCRRSEIGPLRDGQVQFREL